MSSHVRDTAITALDIRPSDARRLPQAVLERLRRVIPAPEISLNLPILESILSLKASRNAMIVAHNYQSPLITAGVADFVGDSLAMARYAVQCPAHTIVVCGVHFMAETIKLLCPEKRVLLPNLNARCSLADSISPEYLRSMRRANPGLPIVAYVNTPAAVKAEADVCCTSANAVAVARSFRVPRIIMIPDRHLAGYVARETDIEVISSQGQCEVHVKYSGTDVDAYRREHNATILAHPECTADIQQRADFVGSTAAMVQIRTRPGRDGCCCSPNARWPTTSPSNIRRSSF